MISDTVEIMGREKLSVCWFDFKLHFQYSKNRTNKSGHSAKFMEGNRKFYLYKYQLAFLKQCSGANWWKKQDVNARGRKAVNVYKFDAPETTIRLTSLQQSNLKSIENLYIEVEYRKKKKL